MMFTTLVSNGLGIFFKLKAFIFNLSIVITLPLLVQLWQIIVRLLAI